jgi:aspartyl-tRNA(Asn)/glutamyl-tRNA(Gln) amidotransferase subunit C
MSQAPDPATLQALRDAARLARLELRGEEAERLCADVARILAHFELLQQVDVLGCEPMVAPLEARGTLREGGPAESLPREELLARAPNTDGEHFLVAKAIGGEA